MRTFGLFFSFLVASLSAFGQNVSVKRDVVLIDEQPAFVFKKINASLMAINSLDGQQLAVLQVVRYVNPNSATTTTRTSRPMNTTTSTSTTTSTYYDVTFMNEELSKCEIPMLPRKALAKEWVHFGLVKDGALDASSMEKYIKIYGQKFSDQIQNTRNTVIISK